jgi:hypothetical protein
MPKKCQDSDLPLGGDLYAGGTYSEGGTYMLVNTALPSAIQYATPVIGQATEKKSPHPQKGLVPNSLAGLYAVKTVGHGNV